MKKLLFIILSIGFIGQCKAILGLRNLWQSPEQQVTNVRVGKISFTNPKRGLPTEWEGYGYTSDGEEYLLTGPKPEKETYLDALEQGFVRKDGKKARDLPSRTPQEREKKARLMVEESYIKAGKEALFRSLREPHMVLTERNLLPVTAVMNRELTDK